MQNTERQKFEEGWKKAFDGAESAPPDHVWNSIELDLVGQESAAMKKKVVFYQRLAAAMLLFGLIAGTYGYYASTGDDKGGATFNEKRETRNVKREAGNVKRAASQNDNNSVRKENSVIPSTDKKEVHHDNSQQQIAFVDETAVEEAPPVEPRQIEKETEVVSTPAIKEENVKEKSGENTNEEEHITEVVSPLLLLEQPENPETVVEPKRSKKQRENLWLALGGSAGNYTPNTPTATTPTISESSYSAKGPALNFDATPVPKKPQPKVGSSYSVGVGVGKRFGRFVVQTGVNLNKQQINYTSNYDAHTTSNTTQTAMADYIGQNPGLTYTNEYTVSSTMDIVSIPVQVGYMIIDRKLGWQINAGVSNDFFLRNVLVDKSGQRSRFTQEAGSESPYRSLNWSALASTELSYRIGQHYRISLVPGARYSFNSILKDTKDTGRPVVLDVGFRFRYIFD